MIVFRVRACNLLHIIQQQPVFCRSKVHHAHDRSSVTGFYRPEDNKSAVLSYVCAVSAFQDQNRIVQNLRDPLDLADRHFRVLLQNGADLLAVHINIAFDCPQPLQRRAGLTQHKGRALRHPGLVPCRHSAFEILCNRHFRRWRSRAAGFFLPLADLHLHVRAQLVRAVVRAVHAGVGIRDDLLDVGVRVVAVDPGVGVHVALDHLLCDLALAQQPLLDLRRHLRPALDKQVISLVLRQLERRILLAVRPDEHGAILRHGGIRIKRLPIDLLRQLPGEEPRVLHAHRPEELFRRLDILASGLLSLRHDTHFLRVVLSKAELRKRYFIPSLCEISRTLRSLSSGVSSLLLCCALANASSLSFGTLTSLPDLSFISNLDTAIVYPFLPCGKARSIGGCRHVLIHTLCVAHGPLLARAEPALLIDLSEALRILLRRHPRRVAVQEIRRCYLVIARSPGLLLQILFFLLRSRFIQLLLRARRLLPGVLHRIQLTHTLRSWDGCK